MAAAKIKKGDSVIVLSGKDKGKTGTVAKVMPKDGKIVELCQAEFKRRTSMVVEGQRSLARLRLAARIAKHALTKQASAHVEVGCLVASLPRSLW